KPVSGRCSSSLHILGIARKTGSHLCTFHGLLIRMPIRNTTKSPSIWALIRWGYTSATGPITSGFARCTRCGGSWITRTQPLVHQWRGGALQGEQGGGRQAGGGCQGDHDSCDRQDEAPGQAFGQTA